MNISEEEVTLEPKELHDILTGKLGFRKCGDCQGACEVWTLHYTLAEGPDTSEQFLDVSEEFATTFDPDNLPPEYSWGECVLYDCFTCKGVGYIPIEGYF